jgi:arabinofuranosyltransferase
MISRGHYFLITLVFLLGVWLNFNYTMDDSFISFRYAQNLLNGCLTWNMGDAPVQGYTSILWVVVLSGLFYLSESILLVKVFSVICILATALLWEHIIYLKTGKHSSLIFVVILLFSGTITQAVSGMETALATLVLSVFIFYSLYGKKDIVLGLLGFIIGLVRPEFYLFSFLSIILTKKFKALIPWSLCLLLYVGWLYQYYGDPLPTSFYMKVLSHKLLPGAESIFFALLVVSPIVLFTRTKEWLLIPVIAVLIFFTRVEHIMNVAYRFEYPLLIVLLGLGTIGLMEKSQKIRIVAVTIFLAINIPMGVKFTIANQSYSRYLEENHMVVAKSISGTVAVSDAGVIPYYSGMKTLDMFGLNDKILCRYRDKDRTDYILNWNPEYIVLISDFPLKYEKQLYQHLSNYSPYLTTKNLSVYQRKEIR